MAFPLFVLAMGIVAALGNTVQNIIIATAIVNFPLYARVARAEANVRREAGFVQAARLSGNGELRILLAQILPNIMPIMIVQMSLTMGYAILNAAGLSFIGLGVRPPTPEWGIMVAEGAAFMVSGEWWIALFPGAGADDRGVLLQPAGRRPARHRRPAAADVRRGHDTTHRRCSTSSDLDRRVRDAPRHRQGRAARQHRRRQGRDASASSASPARASPVTSYAVMRILDRAGRIAEGSVDASPASTCGSASEDADARPARPRNLDDLPEPARGAQPDPQGRPPDRGRAARSTRRRQRRRRDREGHRDRWSRCASRGPRERYHAYPFELSGGMCQRVVIALALACRPQLLIADEPTTGLDVTTQKAVMDLVVELTRERGMSTILITHDLGLAAAYCDRVVVMEKGHVVETATSRDDLHGAVARLYAQADAGDAAARRVRCAICCPRSEALRRADVPPTANGAVDRSGRTSAAAGRRQAGQGISAQGPRPRRCAKLFRSDGRPPEPEMFRAVDGISFTIDRGESVGLVGESGCGKSTTSTMVMRLIDKTDGTITFDGEDIGAIPAKKFAAAAAAQAHPDGVPGPDRQPQSALHRGARHRRSDPAPRRHQGRRRACARAARSWPRRSACRCELLDRFPHQLSGGQKARVGIARAIALKPGPHHPRRADRGARRLGAGGGAQPAAGPEGHSSA